MELHLFNSGAKRAFMAIMAIVVMVSAEAHGGNVIHVPSREAATIQQGIDIARSGDTVLVQPGTYHEAINLSGKAIHLLGAKGPAATKIVGEGTGTIVARAAGEGRGTIIEGFTIAHLADDEGMGAGIGLHIANASPTVRGCVFTGHAQGVLIDGGEPTITGCTFKHNVEASVKIVAGEALIESSAFSHAPFGVWIGANLPGVTRIEDSAFTLHTESAVSSASFIEVAGSTFTHNVSTGGPALRLVGSVVVDCSFAFNVAYGSWAGATSGFGGAVAAGGPFDGAGNHFIRCTFKQNSARLGGAVWGGGMNPLHVEDCTFIANEAIHAGGAIHAGAGVWPQICRSTFTKNSVWLGGSPGGGAIYAASPDITDCVFHRNRAPLAGALYATGLEARIDRCRFIENHAIAGGGVWTPGRVVNSYFSRNVAQGAPAVHLNSGSILNSTFRENVTTGESAAVVVQGNATLADSILWGNMGGEVVVQGDPSFPSVVSNIVMGGYDGGNLDIDPLFAGPHNPRLQPHSPAIDSAANLLPEWASKLDLDGHARNVGKGLDRGAVEFQPVACKPEDFQDLSSISITPECITVKEGVSERLMVTALWGNGSVTDVSASPCITWSSSNAAAATVTYDGVVIGKSPGDAVISAEIGGQAAEAVALCMENGQATYAFDSGNDHLFGTWNAKSFAWFNEFAVVDGAETITEVVINWGGIMDVAAETTVVVWTSPDGDPATAKVVASTKVLPMAAPGEFDVVAVTPTYLGSPGNVFHVGVMRHRPFVPVNPPPLPFAPVDTSAVNGKSWSAGSPTTLDPNAMLPSLIEWGDWLIRASAQPGTFADLNHDLTVDAVDLIMLLSAWGECADGPMGNCPADLNHDRVVDGLDLLLLLANWG